MRSCRRTSRSPDVRRAPDGFHPRYRGAVPGVPLHRLERATQPAPRAHRRSGCGSRSTPPRWRGPGRSSSADTTSGLRGDGPLDGPDRHGGPGPAAGTTRDDRRPGRLLPSGTGPPHGGRPPGGRSWQHGDRSTVRRRCRPGTGLRWGIRPGEGPLPPARRLRAAGRAARRTEHARNDEREDLFGPGERDRATLVRRRCDGRDARPPRLAHRAGPRGQAQADLPAEPSTRATT